MFHMRSVAIFGALALSLTFQAPSSALAGEEDLSQYLDELQAILTEHEADPDVYMRQIEECLVNAEPGAEADLIGSEMLATLQLSGPAQIAIASHAAANGWLETVSFLRESLQGVLAVMR